MLPDRSETEAVDATESAQTAHADASQVEASSESVAVADAAPETADAKAGTETAIADDVTESADEVEAEDKPAPAYMAAVEPAHADDPHHWDGPSIPFVPHHALMEGMMALGFLTLMLALVATIPAPLEARANPFLSPEGVKPEWYFMAPFELLHLVPPLLGLAMTGVAVGILAAWPFIDRKPRRISRRPFVMALSFAIIAAVLALSIYPYIHEG
jgi:quinol-cytochrome oxidoreductase complex cytochrome b subunit